MNLMTCDLKVFRQFSPIVLIVGLVLAVYLPSAGYEFTNLDDDEYVVRNGDIRRINFESVRSWFSKEYVLNYIPVTMASYAVDYHFSKLDPSGYRYTNIAIHCGNAILIYFLVAGITGSYLAPGLVALIFAIHPVQIESVVWIAERKNVLSAFWMLISFTYFRRHNLILTLITFALAVFSKPSVVVLPLLFFMYENSFGKVFHGKGRAMVYIGTIGLASISAFVTLALHASTEIYFRGGNFWSNAWVMSTVFFRYFAHVFYPLNLRTFYTTQLFESVWAWPVICSLAGICAIFFLFVWCWKRNSKLAFWLGWFFIFLLPVSNIFTPISTLMNDRYLYVPLVGLSTFCVLGLNELWKKIRTEQFARIFLWLTACLGGMFILSLLYLSFLRVQQWRDNENLWAIDQGGSQFPDPRFYYNSAVTYFIQGDIQKSIEYMNKVLEFPFAGEKDIMMQAQNYLVLGRPDDAFRYLSSIKSEVSSQLLFTYQDLMAQYYEQKGSLEEAEKFYKQSIKSKPAVPTYQHFAALLMRLGRFDEAVSLLYDGLKIDPDSQGILSRLCNYYLSIQDYEHAYQFYQRLYELNPEDPMVLIISNQLKKFQDAKTTR